MTFSLALPLINEELVVHNHWEQKNTRSFFHSFSVTEFFAPLPPPPIHLTNVYEFCVIFSDLEM